MSVQLEIKNFWKEEDHLFLEEREEICPACKGHGITGAISAEDAFLLLENFEIVGEGSSQGPIAIIFCNSCGGEGKVDWIKRIRGSEIF